ncbi:MAG TPA: dienelactone hydrolase family protein [Thermoanaerobaculia bacterium]|nr:dienelactone hydrolase family protein [Thermoanaerobaculia bacterium]
MNRTIVLMILAFLVGAACFAAARKTTAAETKGAAASAGFEQERVQEQQHLQRMAAEHRHDSPAASPAATTEPAQPVSGSEVTYGTQGGKPLRGYLAHPNSAKNEMPAIVVIHEWWGLNDNIRAMARRLAGEGYAALAVELYGGATADNPDAAMKLMNTAMQNKAAAEENLRLAVQHLKQHGATRIGVIGWCFGGGWSLATALAFPDDIAAAVMYYGRPIADRDQLGRLRAPLLGFFGADDKSIPVAGVHEMESALKQLGKNVEIQVYEGAGHAFANPSGTNYRAAAADDAWKRTVAFFKEKLQRPA